MNLQIIQVMNQMASGAIHCWVKKVASITNFDTEPLEWNENRFSELGFKMGFIPHRYNDTH